MPKLEQEPRRQDADTKYYYRRQLGLGELLPAIGIGIGAGLFAFYVTRLLLQRTPLTVERGTKVARSRAQGLERTARP